MKYFGIISAVVIALIVNAWMANEILNCCGYKSYEQMPVAYVATAVFLVNFMFFIFGWMLYDSAKTNK